MRIVHMDASYEAWLPSFKAADAAHQDFCANVLSRKTKGASQYEQDVFVFFNLFKFWPMQGLKGFYVESGANQAVVDSNTFFFDKCVTFSIMCRFISLQSIRTFQQQ